MISIGTNKGITIQKGERTAEAPVFHNPDEDY